MNNIPENYSRALAFGTHWQGINVQGYSWQNDFGVSQLTHQPPPPPRKKPKNQKTSKLSRKEQQQQIRRLKLVNEK